MDARNKVIFIVGQTASGKSALAHRLAKTLDGEIIAADSQTLRKYLNIGTAKPSQQEMLEVPYHLIDVIEPYERFSVAQFKEMATDAIKSIQSRGKVPIVVGGTGLYVDSIYYDYSLETNGEKGDELEELPIEELKNIIKDNNWNLPENDSNPRHLVGIIRRKGKVPKDEKTSENYRMYGIKRSEEETKKRIADRIEVMIQDGLIDEVRKLVDVYGRPEGNIDAICYPTFIKHLDGEISLEEAKQLFAQKDWQYARRQNSWFKRNQNIVWFQGVEEAYEQILEDINR